MDKRTSKSKRKRDKDAEYEKKKRDRLNSLLNELSTLLQNRKLEFKSSFAKPTKEVVMNDARLYILELKHQLRILSPSIDDPLNRMPMSDDEIVAGFNMLQRSNFSLFARMGGKQDHATATHTCNTLVELAAKSSIPYLGVHAVAIQFVYWGVVVFNPYATLERLTNFTPYYEKHKSSIPKAQMYVMDIHLDVLFAISCAVALVSLGYMDKGMKHWTDGLKLANEIGHPNTTAFVWAAMSIIKYHCEEAFTRQEVIELKNLLVGRWKPYSTFLMAASIVREAKTPDEESEGQQVLAQSAEEAIQVYGSMNDLSIKARSLPVWLKSDPRTGLKVVEGMINRAEKTGATSCMMMSDLYRYKGDMLLSYAKADSIREIESVFRLASESALQSGYSLSYLKCLRSLAKLQLIMQDPSFAETMHNLYSMYTVLKRSCLVQTPFVLQDVESFLKINGFVT